MGENFKMSNNSEPPPPPDPIFIPVHQGDLDKVKQVILEGCNVNMQDSNHGGVTPLILATLQCNIPVMETLMNAGADPNGKDEHDGCPLLAAASNGMQPAMECLLKGKANVNTLDPQGATPLHTAAFFGDLSVVQMLLKHGVRIEAADSAEKTALLLATANLKGIPPPPPPPEGEEPPPPPNPEDLPEHMRPPKDMPPPPGHPDFDEATFSAWVEKMGKEHGPKGKGKGEGGKGEGGKGEGEKGEKGEKGKGGPPKEPQWKDVIMTLLDAKAQAQVSDSQGMSPLMLACDMGEADVAARVSTR